MTIQSFVKSKRFKKSLSQFVAGLSIYGFALLIISILPFYKGYLQNQTFIVLRYLYLAYVVFGFPVCYISDEDSSKPQELLSILDKFPDLFKHFSYNFLNKSKTPIDLTEREKIVLRFSLVKFFYIPLMLSFTLGNINILRNSLNKDFLHLIFSDFGSHYVLITQLFFAIDTFVFCFGYIFESKYLKNTLRTVEPTMIGWVAALASYPPFNDAGSRILGWYSSENFTMPNPVIDTLAKVAIILLIGIYLWATLSLGAKASNLTNRGIVTKGAYKYIRHPAYISKILAWWIMMLPRLSPIAVFSMVGWSLIYYVRAITEEKHLIADPDYQAYVKKTPYRFIPGVI